MKRHLLTICAILLCSVLFGQESFPIMAWGDLGWAHDRSTDPALYEEMRECGFTIAGFASSDAQIEAAAKGGVKVLFHDGGSVSNRDWLNPAPDKWREEVRPVVEKYKDNPAVYGYYVKDEPTHVELPGVFAMADLLKELAPGKLAYVNLFSNSTQVYNYEPDTYAQYTERVFASPLQVSGFDQYVFYHDGYMRNTFYSCMGIHREMALKYKKEWWYCALGIAHRYYAVPTRVQLAHQAYAALAYGAKGLSWFTYLPVGLTGWHSSPLDDFLERTPVWYDMKFVNRSIQNIAYILNHLRSDRVYHFGSTVPETDERVPGPDENSLIKGMENTGNWLVGEFTHEESGERYLIIVNKNLTAPVECKPIWRGKEPARILSHHVSRKSEMPFNRKPNDTNIIPPGMGVLIHVVYDK